MIGNDRKTDRTRRRIFLDFDRSFLFDGWRDIVVGCTCTCAAASCSEGDAAARRAREGGGGGDRVVVIVHSLDFLFDKQYIVIRLL